MLSACTDGGGKPMPYYYAAYYLGKMGRGQAGMLSAAEAACPDYCFPNKLEDIIVLEAAIRENPQGARAYYYLGNLYYDKLQPEKATGLWESSVGLDGGFAIAWRNLALSYYNKLGQHGKAREAMERAITGGRRNAWRGHWLIRRTWGRAGWKGPKTTISITT